MFQFPFPTPSPASPSPPPNVIVKQFKMYYYAFSMPSFLLG